MGQHWEPSSRIVYSIGKSLSAFEKKDGEIVKAWAMDYFDKLFEAKVDVIITPTVSVSPPIVEEDHKICGLSDTPLIMKMMKYIFVTNLIGIPSVTVPVG